MSKPAKAAKTSFEAPIEPVVDAPGVARSFDLATEAFRSTAALPALDRMSERMERRLRDAIEFFARSKPRVAADRVSIRRFEAWRAEKPEFTSLHLYRLRPLKGGVLMAIEPGFIKQLVDAFYGGPGAMPPSAKTDEFTATEERLMVRLTDALATTLTEVWSEVMPVTPQLTSRESNIAYATLVRPEESVAIARFHVAMGSFAPTIVDILYPVTSLRAVESELAAKVFDDATGRTEWRDRLGAAISNVRLEARSVLARPTMSLLEVMQLKPGDVIPIKVPNIVPLLVAGHVIAHGRIGEHDGRAAIKIEKMTQEFQ
jgi:flagellar motor switch protein FliM